MLSPSYRPSRGIAAAVLVLLFPALILLGGCSGANDAASGSSASSPGTTEATSPGATASDEDAPSSLSIEAPASGSLSEEELQRIARDIRTLEKYPATKGARDGRRVLFQWLQGSPDISVSLCGKIVGPLLNADSERQPDILAQYLLSIAAKKIEAPDASTPEAKLSGVEGALNAYSVFLQQEGSGVQNAYMEDLRDMQKDGDLQDYILSEAEGC